MPNLLGDLEDLCLVLLLELEYFEDEWVYIHSDAAAFCHHRARDGWPATCKILSLRSCHLCYRLITLLKSMQHFYGLF